MNEEHRQAIEIFVHDARLRREKPFVTRLAKRLGVTPKTIYDWEKEDPAVARCLADLKAIRNATPPDRKGRSRGEPGGEEGASTESASLVLRQSEEGVAEALSDSDLAAHAHQAIRRVRMLIQQASGLVEHRGNLPDLPFLVYKLDEFIPRMQKVLHDLRGYRDEWQRRYKPEAKTKEQAGLFQ